MTGQELYEFLLSHGVKAGCPFVDVWNNLSATCQQGWNAAASQLHVLLTEMSQVATLDPDVCRSLHCHHSLSREHKKLLYGAGYGTCFVAGCPCIKGRTR